MPDKKKHGSIWVHADRITLGGLIAMNLGVLEGLISLQAHDILSNIAFAALSISIPTAGGYLFIRFLQEAIGIKNHDWKIIGTMSIVAGVSGLIGITATMWRELPLAGVLFLATSLVTVITCVLYVRFIGISEARKERVKINRENDTEENK